MAGKEITLILPKYNKGMYGFPAPPMPVLYLASVTPKQYKVKVIDERVEEVRYNKTDMVGISVKTCTAKRAYEIASNYRKMGIKVVLGGVHVSALP
ncbi:MAG: cobalamin-dependent protein, partial [Nanoarchaeota archaeon]|nr:cobalamin-dependent protein [Nanoarchaeota archaeon]